jgi:CubicO group peptidase (beta-lactamase class C family)
VFFRDEIAIPLGLDFYIGLPVEISNERLAVPTFSFPISALRQASPPTVLGLLNPSSLARRALSNPRVDASLARDTIYRRGLELPSVNGIGSAKAIARAYSVFATGGAELGITPQTMAALTDPTVTPDKGQDLVLHITWTLSLGFARPSVGLPFGTGPRSFGAPGLGGSFGFADPDRQIGYAYTPNKMIMAQGRDPREIALRSALSRCLARM